ncbi:ATP-binding cassette domain-containing protein [Nitratireductor sp. XY-223]|uniref:ATP-binding cassette domain-containing protein n=1 Tax=Nitratireductor sp. XY-223 TaxID=2561926 RepID=UPI0010AA5BFF|nr:ATP-binding cassette domain-containing protein [Nitratireductor sp. XY-223]
MAVKEQLPRQLKTLVVARDIGIRRGGRWIIRHVNLTVRRNEIIYLIGANGAGKTTCAKALLGLTDPDEGTVERPRSLEVGYVPQRLAMAPTLPLTLRRLMTLTGRFDQQEIDDALVSVGLENLGNPQVATLSGGELQRLLLARALIHRPDLLVLDEPVQGVDIAGTDALHKLVAGITRDLGCGVLLISHDIQKAMETGSDVVVLVPHEHDEKTGAGNLSRVTGRRSSGFSGGLTGA